MNRALFLDVNGAVRGSARSTRRFQLPNKKQVLNSMRFGNHVYVLGRTMQMLPLGSAESPLEPASTATAWQLGARKVLDLLSPRRLYLLTLLQ